MTAAERRKVCEAVDHLRAHQPQAAAAKLREALALEPAAVNFGRLNAQTD